jgi:hypothetical protein
MSITSDSLLRLAFQFKDSTNFRAFLSAFLAEFDELDVARQQLLDDRYIDTAVGVQLDLIGEILGFPRPEFLDESGGFFGFFGNPNALPFGLISPPFTGGNFYSIQFNPKTPVVDSDYRKILKAKALQNVSNMTVDETTNIISVLMGGVSVQYTLPSNLNPVYVIDKVLTSIDISLLRTLPELLCLESINYTGL